MDKLPSCLMVHLIVPRQARGLKVRVMRCQNARVYQRVFKIFGYPCSLIGSQQFDVFTYPTMLLL